MEWLAQYLPVLERAQTFFAWLTRLESDAEGHVPSCLRHENHYKMGLLGARLLFLGLRHLILISRVDRGS